MTQPFSKCKAVTGEINGKLCCEAEEEEEKEGEFCLRNLIISLGSRGTDSGDDGASCTGEEEGGGGCCYTRQASTQGGRKERCKQASARFSLMMPPSPRPLWIGCEEGTAADR